MPTVHQRYGQTDGRTDGWTDGGKEYRAIVLRSSCRKNVTKKELKIRRTREIYFKKQFQSP